MEHNLPYAKDEDLPTLDVIQAGIRRIEDTSFERMTYEEIRMTFFDCFQQMPLLLMSIAGVKIPAYRVTDGQFSGFDATRTNSFSHPPARACRAGRVNLASHPVLYASMSAVTAMLEFRKSDNQPLKKGDIIYVSDWTIDEAVPGFCSQFVFGDDISIGESLKELNLHNRNKVNHSSKPYTGDTQEANWLLLESLSRYFITDENYAVSSFLGHHMLYENRNTSWKADLLLYPSVQSKLNSINLAVHPDFVAKHMKLKEVQKVIFEGMEDDGAHFALLEVGMPLPDGSIEWFKHGFSRDAVKVAGVKLLVSDVHGLVYCDDEPVLIMNDRAYHPLELARQLVDTHFDEVLNLISGQKKEYGPDNIYSLTINITPVSGSVYTDYEERRIDIEGLEIDLKYKSVLFRKAEELPSKQ